MPRRKRTPPPPDPDFDDGLGENLVPVDLDALTHDELVQLLGAGRRTVDLGGLARLDRLQQQWERVAAQFPDPGGVKRYGISPGAVAYRQLQTIHKIRGLLAKTPTTPIPRTQDDDARIVSLAIELGFQHADAIRRLGDLGDAARAGRHQSRVNRENEKKGRAERLADVATRHAAILKRADAIRKITPYDPRQSNTTRLAEQVAARLGMKVRTVREVLDRNGKQ
jgi:hypothetical protein